MFVERWYVSAMSTPSTPAIDRCAIASVRNDVAGVVAAPDPRRGDRDHREIDRGVAQARPRAGDRHRDDVVVAHPVAELAQHDRHLDRLAVLVAGVELERVRESAEAEDAVAGLDVVERMAGPAARPFRQDPVARCA